jgi:DNA-binding NarL/FixJ family response regulator
MHLDKIRIILADDHDILTDGIESILNEAPHLQVVGKASSANAAEALVKKLAPDLLLTDISMGAISGLDLTKRVLRQFPLTRVIVLTMHDDAQHITDMLQAGALGYLLKNVKQAELFTAIKQVMQGQQYIQQSLAAEYNRFIQRKKQNKKNSLLTPREIEIIKLVAQEMTTAQISRQLFLSEHTVETHRKNIVRKTGAKTVIGIVNYARENGLL